MFQPKQEIFTMQMIINVPECLPQKLVRQRIREIEIKLNKEAESVDSEIIKESQKPGNDDAWSEFLENIDEYAVETGIKDLAENHDHYLYGVPKE